MLETKWIIVISVAAVVFAAGITVLVLWLTGVLFKSEAPTVTTVEAGVETKCTSTSFSHKNTLELTHDYRSETLANTAGFGNTTMMAFSNFAPPNSPDRDPINTVARFTVTTDTEVVTSELNDLAVTAGRAYIATPFAATDDSVVVYAEMKADGETALSLNYTNEDSAFRLVDVKDTNKTQSFTKTGYTARMCFYDGLEDELVLVWNKSTENLIETHKRDGEYRFLTTASSTLSVTGANKVDPYNGTLAGTTLCISAIVLSGGGNVLHLRRGGSGWEVVERIHNDTVFTWGWNVSISRNGLRMAVGAPQAEEATGRVYVYTRTATDGTWVAGDTVTPPSGTLTNTLAQTTSVALGFGSDTAYAAETLAAGSTGKFVLVDTAGTATELTMDGITTYGRCSNCGTHRNGERDATVFFYQQDSRSNDGSATNAIIPQVQYFTVCTAV
jgi:hypothetical protein